MDDTFIQNATSTEKLCFMILDQIKRTEDTIDQLHNDVEYLKRWVKYKYFDKETYGRKLQLFRIIKNIDPYWTKLLFSEHCPMETVCMMIDWVHVDHLDAHAFEKRFLEYFHTMPKLDHIKAVWYKLPINEIDKI